MHCSRPLPALAPTAQGDGSTGTRARPWGQGICRRRLAVCTKGEFNLSPSCFLWSVGHSHCPCGKLPGQLLSLGFAGGWVRAVGVLGGLCRAWCLPSTPRQQRLVLLTPQVWSIQSGLATSCAVRCVGRGDLQLRQQPADARAVQMWFCGRWVERGLSPRVQGCPQELPGSWAGENRAWTELGGNKRLLGCRAGGWRALSCWERLVVGAHWQHGSLPCWGLAPLRCPSPSDIQRRGNTVRAGKLRCKRLNHRGWAMSPALGIAVGTRVCTAVFAEPPAGRGRGSPVVHAASCWEHAKR